MLKCHHSKPMKNFLGIIVLATATSIAIAAPNLDNHDAATAMKISNSSKYPLTFSIDSGCSEEIGVTEAHSVKVISQKRINNACKSNPDHCAAQVYSTDNCTGKPIATFVIDMNSGVLSVLGLDSSYHLGGSGFNLFFDGPWV